MQVEKDEYGTSRIYPFQERLGGYVRVDKEGRVSLHLQRPLRVTREGWEAIKAATEKTFELAAPPPPSALK